MVKYNYYPGCTLKTTGIELERSALKVSPLLGFELVELPRWHCCGTIVSLSMDSKIYSLGAVRTLIRAQETGNPKLLTLCSMCYNTLLRINDRFNNDSEFKDAVVQFMDEEPEYDGKVEILHYVDILREISPDAIRKAVIRPLNGLKVSAYYGCLLLRPKEFSVDPNPENPVELEKHIEALGAEPVDNPYKIVCCGSYQSVNNPELVAGMVYDIVEGARQNDADAIITYCPLCHFNLDKFQKLLMKMNPQFTPMPILYFTQLMELAMVDKKPSWEKHHISPVALVDKVFGTKATTQPSP